MHGSVERRPPLFWQCIPRNQIVSVSSQLCSHMCTSEHTLSYVLALHNTPASAVLLMAVFSGFPLQSQCLTIPVLLCLCLMGGVF